MISSLVLKAERFVVIGGGWIDEVEVDAVEIVVEVHVYMWQKKQERIRGQQEVSLLRYLLSYLLPVV